MKKVILGLGLLSVIFLASCNKSVEQTQPNAQSSSQGTTHTTANKFKGTGKYVDWDHWKCPQGDGNCLDEVVVTTRPKKLEMIVSFTMEGRLRDLLNTDSDVYNDLTSGGDEITRQYIDGVKSGVYRAAIKTDAPNASSDKVALIFGGDDLTNSNYDVVMLLGR